MKRAAAVTLVLVLLAAGCTERAVETTTVVPSTTSTTAPTATTSRSTTTSTTPLPPATSALPPWPEPGFPEAFPPEAIPWEEVGAGWLLVDYAPPSPVQSGMDPNTTRAVFLVDPDDNWYGALAWPGPGIRVLDWSPDGRRILTLDWRQYPGLSIVDLRDGTATSVPVESAGEYGIYDARFTRPTGEDIVVRLLDDWNRMRARLEVLHQDGSRFALLVDRGLISSSDPEHVPGGVSWLYAMSGTQVVVATSDGIRLLGNQGVLVRPLDAPGLGCTLTRWWDDGSVLAACWDGDWAASECWDPGWAPPGGRSLWVVPVDGSPATRLTPRPVCGAEGNQQFADAYGDGLQVGGVVAATHDLRVACSGGLDLIAGGTVTPWLQYSGSAGTWWACGPELIAARGERLLVWDWAFTDRPEPEQGFGVIFEVAVDGTALRLLSPVERGRYGGVLQVFTTEETAVTAGQW